MTPPAATPAGATRARATSQRHGRTLRRAPAPKAPRRVSGPARPGRLSERAAVRRRAPLRRARPIGARALAFFRALPDHPLLDRIVRGRAWIVLLGVLLSGIVAMQVEMLKLNASVGRSIELGAALQSRNEILRASVSALSDPQRIERLATRMGMVIPGPTSIGFLDASRVDPAQAAADIQAPAPAAFESALQAAAPATATARAAPATATAPAAPATAAAPTPTP